MPKADLISLLAVKPYHSEDLQEDRTLSMGKNCYFNHGRVTIKSNADGLGIS